MRTFENFHYTNSEIIAVIDDHVHSERDREILKDRFVNGLTFEQLAEKHYISVRNAQRIIYKYDRLLLKFIL